VSKPLAFLDYPQAMKLSYGPYIAASDRIIDPDTFLLVVSLGFDRYEPVTIRLDGLYAPETNEIGFEDWLEVAKPLLPRDTPVQLYSRTGSFVPTFTRFVGSIRLDDGSDLANRINEGIAAVLEGKGFTQFEARPVRMMPEGHFKIPLKVSK
jgi:hypothetical protein